MLWLRQQGYSATDSSNLRTWRLRQQDGECQAQDETLSVVYYRFASVELGDRCLNCTATLAYSEYTCLSLTSSQVIHKWHKARQHLYLQTRDSTTPSNPGLDLFGQIRIYRNLGGILLCPFCAAISSREPREISSSDFVLNYQFESTSG